MKLHRSTPGSLLLTALISMPTLAGDLGPYYSNLSALMNAMKSRGCTFDGITTDPDPAGQAALVNRSPCQYLHRALETWTNPPDFDQARHVLSQMTKRGMVYGMFIAEAISTNKPYYYPDENRSFRFQDMCRPDPGAQDYWGPNTCIPSFQQPEYQKYVRYIVTRALDIGIQDLAFGQVYLVDDVSNPRLPALMADYRAIARNRGQRAILGGQTNDISNVSYLQSFDYVFGGVGERSDQPPGYLEPGPCATKVTGFCWALLWTQPWISSARNVLINFDWASDRGDDSNVFAGMTPLERSTALAGYYNAFLGNNVGFLLPYSMPLAGAPDTCHGSNPWVYSPDNRFTCQDEAALSNAVWRRRADLQPCHWNTECTSNVCQDGYCGYKPDGWGCTGDDACASHFCSSAGVCTARKADLTACSTGRECASDICLDGFCGLKPDGWGCASDAACASYYCSPSPPTVIGGTCTARKTDLSSCTSGRQCASWVCLDGFCGLKPAGWGCVDGSVCASHACVNGLCQ